MDGGEGARMGVCLAGGGWGGGGGGAVRAGPLRKITFSKLFLSTKKREKKVPLLFLKKINSSLVDVMFRKLKKSVQI